jgi:hypothetical protein
MGIPLLAKDLIGKASELHLKGWLSSKSMRGVAAIKRVPAGLRNDRALLSRTKWVRKNYAAIRLAWVLTHGSPKDHIRPKNRAKVVSFFNYLRDLVFNGPSHLKRLAHEWRKVALEGGPYPPGIGRSVPVDALFIASTVARATFMDMSYLHNENVEKTLDRWHSQPPDIHPLILRSIYEFVVKRARNATEKGDYDPLDVPCPELNGKACIEKSTREGGVAVAANEANKALADGIREKLLARIRQINPAFDPSTSTIPLPSAQELDDRLAYSFAMQEARGLRKTGLAPPIRPVPLTELGCKVRVASMHPWCLAHVGRCFAKRTLPVLKRLNVTREVLQGQEVHVQGEYGSLLYSADLSAASDYIPHEVGMTVLNALTDGLGWAEEDLDAFTTLVDPMRSPRGLTTRGLHMGLGSTWTILSLLNAWAASSSPNKSFRICGDDLIGQWNEAQRQEYERRIESIGLVLNRAKAFNGNRGVFCERIVESRDILIGSSRTVATSRSLPKISELVGARQTIERTGGLAILRDVVLQYTRTMYIPKEARQAAQRFLRDAKVAGAPKGPAGMGGGGGNSGKHTDPGLLTYALIHGVRAPGWGAAAHKEFYANLLAHERKGAKHHNDVPMTEAAIPYLAVAVRKERRAGAYKAPTLTLPALAREGKKRSRTTLLPSTLRDAIRHCPSLTSKGRRIAIKALQDYGLYRLARLNDISVLKAKHPKAYGRLANVVYQHTRTRYVSPVDIDAVLTASHVQPPHNQRGEVRPWAWAE